MEPRIDLITNEIGATFAKRFANASMVIARSPLPRSTQELVALRASQINGCGWCALVCLVAMINAANRLGVIVRQKGGSYEPGMFASMTT